MSNETLQQFTDLCAQVRVEKTKAEEARKTLINAEYVLYETVKKHNELRLQYFKELLESRDMTWCTSCFALIPKNETRLVLIAGVEQYDYGYGNFFYDFRDFSKVHRACSSCGAYFAKKHGEVGPVDLHSKKQERFHAFDVLERGGHFFAERFGVLKPCSDMEMQLPDFPEKNLDKLGPEWGIPQKIGVEKTNLGELKVTGEPNPIAA